MQLLGTPSSAVLLELSRFGTGSARREKHQVTCRNIVDENRAIRGEVPMQFTETAFGLL